MPDPGHPGVSVYLRRKAEALAQGLHLEVNGRRLPVERSGADIIFPEGAGGLPTLKMAIRYRARLDTAASPALRSLHYRDANYPDRAGWKEIVASAGPGVRLLESTAPERDRSRELSDYPTDLLDSPPQDLEARLAFTGQPAASAAPASDVRAPHRAAAPARLPGTAAATPRPALTASIPAPAAISARSPASPPSTAVSPEPIALRPNVRATPRSSFTELMVRRDLSLGVVLAALVVAAGLGGFHALEPGHGKTVVAAYLVGARGTARHAAALGLIVTASHTAGVFLLGGVTLYATRYVVPERLYPWLGAISGLTIAGLGVYLLLTRWRGSGHAGHLTTTTTTPPLHHHDDHHLGPSPCITTTTRARSRPCAGARGAGHPRRRAHHAHGDHGHSHRMSSWLPSGRGRWASSPSPAPGETVSARQLLALGITGGLVPCPAALVVLLSAISLGRVGFGLLLIVAFSLGLAAVLTGIGLLMVYARRFMRRFHGEGPVITRWLPIASAAVITLVGMAIAIQALAPTALIPGRL